MMKKQMLCMLLLGYFSAAMCSENKETAQVGTSIYAYSCVANGYHRGNIRNKSFEESIGWLSGHIMSFVDDFKTWPKEEKDKIAIIRDDSGLFCMGLVLLGAPRASHRYEDDIVWYLSSRLLEQEKLPLFCVLHHLKKEDRLSKNEKIVPIPINKK
jgi:hypothetical protein